MGSVARVASVIGAGLIAAASSSFCCDEGPGFAMVMMSVDEFVEYFPSVAARIRVVRVLTGLLLASAFATSP